MPSRQDLSVRFKRWRKRNRPEVLYTYAFPVPGDAASRTEGGYRLVELEQGVLDQLRDAAAAKEFPDRKYQQLRGRIGATDQTCWVILDEAGEACGYCHATWEDNLNARINHRVRVGPTQSYFYDDHVFKRHRRRGLHHFSIARRMELAAERGVTQGLTTISKKNVASRASYGRLQARPTGTLVYLPTVKRTLRLPAPRSARRAD